MTEPRALDPGAVTGTAYTGSGVINDDTDYHYVCWIGKTKSGKPLKIEIFDAINLGNIDLTFAEKDDVIPEIVMTATYDDEKLAAGDRTEPWKLTAPEGVTVSNGAVVLGAGKFCLGSSPEDAVVVGLSRGGGKFEVERENRLIAADDDPGPVKGRIQQEGGVVRLTMHTLQWLGSFADLYPGIVPADVQPQDVQPQAE